MRISFRADASLQIGTGHVMRCLTLADALREHGAQCSFVCRQHEGHLLELITQRGYQSFALPVSEWGGGGHDCTAHANWLGTDWATDVQDTQKALGAYVGNESVDWLVVDHYALDARWEDAMRKQARRIMVIDDLADRPHNCELLLDQNLGRKADDYCDLINGHAATLIGPQYALLRPEFAALRLQTLARRQSCPQLSRLLITMGGVDKNNVTGQVLDALQACSLPTDLLITVVMGPHAPWLSQVQAQAAQMPWNTDVLVCVNNMASLMSASDFAIGAAGSTSWERCCLGLPTIQVALAKNQEFIAEALSMVGAALILSDKVITERLPEAINALLAHGRLQSITKVCSSITQGQGAQLVSECLKHGGVL